jgi:hypothetical protein
LVLACAGAVAVLPAAETAAPEPTRLAFVAHGNEFRFDTGALRGSLRGQGKSLGLRPVVDSASGAELAGAYGLFSHYRLLDADARYGTAAWDWASQSRLLAEGAVESRWVADAGHPFDLQAVYCWQAADTLDLTTQVTAQRDLRRLEVFLASYFAGFPESLVYVGPNPEGGFLAAKKEAGTWQAFPRDEEAVKIIGDGRWQRPPSPVEWKIMPRWAAPLAMRRDAERGWTALLMAPREDCFAVLTPFGEEGHRSVYLSLFGRDLKAGATAAAHTRLVIRRSLTESQAVALYEDYLRDLDRERRSR